MRTKTGKRTGRNREAGTVPLLLVLPNSRHDPPCKARYPTEAVNTSQSHFTTTFSPPSRMYASLPCVYALQRAAWTNKKLSYWPMLILPQFRITNIQPLTRSLSWARPKKQRKQLWLNPDTVDHVSPLITSQQSLPTSRLGYLHASTLPNTQDPSQTGLSLALALLSISHPTLSFAHPTQDPLFQPVRLTTNKLEILDGAVWG